MPVDQTHRLTEPTELLHRQVHPQFIVAGRVSSQAFRPTPKDRGLLSVARSTLISARDAMDRYTAAGNATAGVMSVSVHECESLGLPAYSDPLPPDDDAHAVVDFNVFESKSKRETVGDRLAARARERGWQASKQP